MKKHAQAILLFTGYPLEPIVALEIQKSYQAEFPHVFNNTSLFTATQPAGLISKIDAADVRWFCNYE